MPLSPRSSRKTLLLAPVLVLVVQAVLACNEDPNDDSNPFREDVVRCEDAVAHASSCCHGKVAAPPDACVFSHWEEQCGGCSAAHGQPGRRDIWPVLSIAESSHIEGESCAVIDCAAVAALVARQHSSESKGSLDCY